MTTNFPNNGLQRLILDKKGDRSNTRLSAACGGNPTATNLQRLMTRPLKDFPTADVMRGLSKGLGVRVIDILHAAAISVGLPVTSDDGSALILDGAGHLPEESQALLKTMAEQMLWWQEQAEATPDNVTEFPSRDWGTMAADSKAGDTGTGDTIDPEQDTDDA